jgi:hypothetical protein
MSIGKVSERKIILFTAGLVVFAGIVRLMSYNVGSVFFYLAFAPFIVYRSISTYKQWESKKSSLDGYRILILILILVTITLNIAGWQEADFFLIFLLMIDYLLVINKKF